MKTLILFLIFIHTMFSSYNFEKTLDFITDFQLLIKNKTDELSKEKERIEEEIATLKKNLEILTKENQGLKTENNNVKKLLNDCQKTNEQIKTESSNILKKTGEVKEQDATFQHLKNQKFTISRRIEYFEKLSQTINEELKEIIEKQKKIIVFIKKKNKETNEKEIETINTKSLLLENEEAILDLKNKILNFNAIYLKDELNMIIQDYKRYVDQMIEAYKNVKI